MLTRCTLLAATVALTAALPFARAQAETPTELNFGIISTELSQNARPAWTPLLEDMSKAVGMKVNAFFAPDYAGIIEAMRFNKVQIAWYGNASAMQAVDRAEGEVFAQTVQANGDPGYWSVIIVKQDSPIKSFEDLLASPGKYSFSNGDPNSTSGYLIPGYFAWAKNKVDIRSHFTKVTSGNHESNALAVATGQVDVATFNTENFDRLKKNNPEKAALIREIWRSPLIPNDPIVWRKDLDDGLKNKVKTFLISYGVEATGKSAEAVDHEKQVLAGLLYRNFNPSSDSQLLLVRKVTLFKERAKIEADDKLTADEKKTKFDEIDAKLAALEKAPQG